MLHRALDFDVGSCEYGIESLCSMKIMEFLD